MNTPLKHGHIVETPEGFGVVRGFRGADVLVLLDNPVGPEEVAKSPRRFERGLVAPLECRWSLLCSNHATRTRRHSILGAVLICGRCDRKVEALV